MVSVKKEHFLLLAVVIGTLVFWNTLAKATSPRREGMENATSAKTNGIGGTAASYAAGLKAQVVALQDELITTKYRAQYEEAIIHLSDLVGTQMLRQALQVTTPTQAEDLAALNTLAQARTSLNDTMKYLNSMQA
jgi:hypothetical protein